MRLTRIILFATDMPRMAAFYREALGLRLIEGSPEQGWVRLDAGGCEIALHAIPEPIAAGIHIETPPLPRADSPIKVALQVDDVDAARASLAERGAIMYDVRRTDGAALCDGLDPEGNVFQITSR
ncbi:MAG TPA: VOC family protein [Kofleriaceae bacterium]|nr:VOC family protein [Kofleriaceae bacterium]